MVDHAIWGRARWGLFRWGISTLQQLDPARCGQSRVNACRCSVYKPVFPHLLKKIENILPKASGGFDPAICGHARCGYSRCGVYVPLFDQLKKQFESLGG